LAGFRSQQFWAPKFGEIGSSHLCEGVCDDLEIDVRFFVCAEQNILTSSGAADAMSQVDRKLFVPDPRLAYKDAPQVIGK
jgi:hypothetical protein